MGPMIMYALMAQQNMTQKSTEVIFMNNNGIFRTPNTNSHYFGCFYSNL